MKTIIESQWRPSIEEFAEKYNLTMKVTERDLRVRHPQLYYARFDGAEIKGDCILRSAYGNGHTPEEAIANYANEISGKLLVIGAFTDGRREIRVPVLAEPVTKGAK